MANGWVGGNICVSFEAASRGATGTTRVWTYVSLGGSRPSSEMAIQKNQDKAPKMSLSYLLRVILDSIWYNGSICF